MTLYVALKQPFKHLYTKEVVTLCTTFLYYIQNFFSCNTFLFIYIYTSSKLDELFHNLSLYTNFYFLLSSNITSSFTEHKILNRTCNIYPKMFHSLITQFTVFLVLVLNHLVSFLAKRSGNDPEKSYYLAFLFNI